MASQLDLQEQEQLDELKAFWKQHGNLITWVLVAVMTAFAAWNGWQWWQRDQGNKAASMFDAMQTATDAGDAARAAQVFGDLKSSFGRTAYAGQGGLLAARVQYDKGQADDALASLAWVADNASVDEYRAIARLRAAGILADQKKYDEALRQLDGVKGAAFEALAADRRGDVLAAQGKKDEAKTAYQAAWKAMDSKLEYRQLIDAKLTALGAAPAASGVAP